MRQFARSSRVRSALVVAEVGLSVLLLVAAALMKQTFLRLQRIELGFQPEHVPVARVTKFEPGRRTERSALLSGFINRFWLVCESFQE